MQPGPLTMDRRPPAAPAPSGPRLTFWQIAAILAGLLLVLFGLLVLLVHVFPVHF